MLMSSTRSLLLLVVVLLVACTRPIVNAQDYSLCSTPAAGCFTLSNTDCLLYTGCTWIASTKRCQKSTSCDETNCRLKDLAFRISRTMLPGCINQNTKSCANEQISAFRALALGTSCSATEPPGDTLNKFRARRDTGAPDEYVLYVSPMGSDNNKGTLKTSALKTLQFAVDLMRASRAPRKHIFLLPGVHRMAYGIVLMEEDSNLTIEGLDGAIISGAAKLPHLNWEPVSLGSRIYRADLSHLSEEDMQQFGPLSRLYVNGEAQTRARAPNVNAYSDHGRFAGSVNVDSWPHNPTKAAASTIRQQVVNASSGVFRYQLYDLGVGGQCAGMYEPPAGYWCDPRADGDSGCPLDWPTGVNLKDSMSSFLQLKTGWAYSTSTRGYFHTLHPSKWGGWTFEITKASGRSLSFGKGGFQEARGDCGAGGGDFYIENVYELLDYWKEFFLDLPNKKLFVFSDSSPQNMPMELGTVLDRAISVVGSSAYPARNIKLLNLIVEKTYSTHMHPHEMPSGGDIAIHRGGAIYVEGAEDIVISDCTFRNMGTNAIFLSNYARRVEITRNTFSFLEGGPIAIVGDPMHYAAQPWDRRNDQEYIADVLIKNNVAHDMGLVEMQSCAVLISIAKNIVVEENVFYNGPRGAVVLNDIFGGNIVVRQNVIFNFVRETWDHGPFNSWNRQQWLFEPGFAQPVYIDTNYIIGTVDGQKLVDCDDGAQDHVITNNILINGYIKFKGYNLFAKSNVVVGLDPNQQWGCLLMLATHRTPASWVYEDNTCYLGGTLPTYTWRSSTQALCNPADVLMKANRNNGFFINWRDWRCGTAMKDWQALGQDMNTTWNRDLAATATILSEVEAKAEPFFYTDMPTVSPTFMPSTSPSQAPTSSAPTFSPTTSQPSRTPTFSAPTKSPTSSRPTPSPTFAPTRLPTSEPTGKPTRRPTSEPTRRPTKTPTLKPTKPTPRSPTFSSPTLSPTTRPSLSPSTLSPTKLPTALPTRLPTKLPTQRPTQSPTSSSPSTSPTSSSPTLSPTTSLPTASPTHAPTRMPTTLAPSESPTKRPTREPTTLPTKSPTREPTLAPSQLPTLQPTHTPTKLPTSNPSSLPTLLPTKLPTAEPSSSPSASPSTLAPTFQPSTLSPTKTPTARPTRYPTWPRPSASPSEYFMPTRSPITKSPTMEPTTRMPTTLRPTRSPTTFPTWHKPSQVPTIYWSPTRSPVTRLPTRMPTTLAPSTLSPTNSPTMYPTFDSPTSSPSEPHTPTISPHHEEEREEDDEEEEDFYEEEDYKRKSYEVQVDAEGNNWMMLNFKGGDDGGRRWLAAKSTTRARQQQRRQRRWQHDNTPRVFE